MWKRAAEHKIYLYIFMVYIFVILLIRESFPSTHDSFPQPFESI